MSRHPPFTAQKVERLEQSTYPCPISLHSTPISDSRLNGLSLQPPSLSRSPPIRSVLSCYMFFRFPRPGVVPFCLLSFYLPVQYDLNSLSIAYSLSTPADRKVEVLPSRIRMISRLIQVLSQIRSGTRCSDWDIGGWWTTLALSVLSLPFDGAPLCRSVSGMRGEGQLTGQAESRLTRSMSQLSMSRGYKLDGLRADSYHRLLIAITHLQVFKLRVAFVYLLLQHNPSSLVIKLCPKSPLPQLSRSQTLSFARAISKKSCVVISVFPTQPLSWRPITNDGPLNLVRGLQLRRQGG